MTRRFAGAFPLLAGGCITRTGLALLSAMGAIAEAATAEDFELSGSVSTEMRLFPQDPAFAGQADDSVSLSLSIAPKFVHEFNGGSDRLTFEPFLRVDSGDSNRTHWDIRTLSWLHLGEGWDLVVGVDKVFWGVTESRHLVDIVNQDDAVEDIDGEAKLGQPMVNLNLLRSWGRLGVFVLPGFRERAFPANDARLRGPLPIATGRAVFEAGAGNVDFALRYSNTFDAWDLGLYYFHGTSREPRLLPAPGPGGQLVMIPYYDLIDQVGLDLQYTTGAWLWKLEAIARSGHGDPFLATVAGFEYTHFGVVGTNADLGLIAEFSYDGRDPATAPPTVYDNDLFLGSRLSLNDIDDTSVLAGGLIDIETGSTGLFLEAERRIGENWRVILNGRFFTNVATGDPLAGMEQDGFFSLSLSRYF